MDLPASAERVRLLGTHAWHSYFARHSKIKGHPKKAQFPVVTCHILASRDAQNGPSEDDVSYG